MAGPTTASSSRGAAPNSFPSIATAASRMPAAAPRQPAWTAAATRRPRSTSSTGMQSAVTTPTSWPGVAVTSPSAACAGPAAAISTRVPCTWRAVRTGRCTPSRATAASQPSPFERPRNPWRSPGTACHGSYVSIASLAGRRGLRYGAPRADARPRAVRPGARARGPGADRVGGAARLAPTDRRPPAGRVDRALASRLDALERHVGVTEQLLERRPLVLVLVVDAPDARVHQHLEAVNARRVRDVDVGVADAGAVLRRLRDRVDLGVDRAEAVLLGLAGRRAGRVDEAADVGAVRQAGRRAVVPGSEDVLVAHDDGADLGAIAGGALGHLPRDRHEVLLPARALSGGRVAHGRMRIGSGTNVRTKTATVAHAASTRGPSSGRASFWLGGWPRRAMEQVLAAQKSQPGQPRGTSQRDAARRTAEQRR